MTAEKRCDLSHVDYLTAMLSQGLVKVVPSPRDGQEGLDACGNQTL
jgi:hypothetical protein